VVDGSSSQSRRSTDDISWPGAIQTIQTASLWNKPQWTKRRGVQATVVTDGQTKALGEATCALGFLVTVAEAYYEAARQVSTSKTPVPAKGHTQQVHLIADNRCYNEV